MKEKKTRNVVFALKPTVYEQFKKIAHMQNITANSLVNILIEDYTDNHQNLVAVYDQSVVPFKHKNLDDEKITKTD